MQIQKSSIYGYSCHSTLAHNTPQDLDLSACAGEEREQIIYMPDLYRKSNKNPEVTASTVT